VSERPVTDGRLRRAPRTVAAIVALPVHSDGITVERRLVGDQVVTRYVYKSDGSPVPGLGEIFHHQGIEGGFIPPPSGTFSNPPTS
jgi:hypothetical protein